MNAELYLELLREAHLAAIQRGATLTGGTRLGLGERIDDDMQFNTQTGFQDTPGTYSVPSESRELNVFADAALAEMKVGLTRQELVDVLVNQFNIPRSNLVYAWDIPAYAVMRDGQRQPELEPEFFTGNPLDPASVADYMQSSAYRPNNRWASRQGKDVSGATVAAFNTETGEGGPAPKYPDAEGPVYEHTNPFIANSATGWGIEAALGAVLGPTGLAAGKRLLGPLFRAMPQLPPAVLARFKGVARNPDEWVSPHAKPFDYEADIGRVTEADRITEELEWYKAGDFSEVPEEAAEFYTDTQVAFNIAQLEGELADIGRAAGGPPGAPAIDYGAVPIGHPDHPRRHLRRDDDLIDRYPEGYMAEDFIMNEPKVFDPETSAIERKFRAGEFTRDEADALLEGLERIRIFPNAPGRQELLDGPPGTPEGDVPPVHNQRGAFDQDSEFDQVVASLWEEMDRIRGELPQGPIDPTRGGFRPHGFEDGTKSVDRLQGDGAGMGGGPPDAPPAAGFPDDEIPGPNEAWDPHPPGMEEGLERPPGTERWPSEFGNYPADWDHLLTPEELQARLAAEPGGYDIDGNPLWEAEARWEWEPDEGPLGTPPFGSADNPFPEHWSQTRRDMWGQDPNWDAPPPTDPRINTDLVQTPYGQWVTPDEFNRRAKAYKEINLDHAGVMDRSTGEFMSPTESARRQGTLSSWDQILGEPDPSPLSFTDALKSLGTGAAAAGATAVTAQTLFPEQVEKVVSGLATFNDGWWSWIKEFPEHLDWVVRATGATLDGMEQGTRSMGSPVLDGLSDGFREEAGGWMGSLGGGAVPVMGRQDASMLKGLSKDLSQQGHNGQAMFPNDIRREIENGDAMIVGYRSDADYQRAVEESGQYGIEVDRHFWRKPNRKNIRPAEGQPWTSDNLKKLAATNYFYPDAGLRRGPR